MIPVKQLFRHNPPEAYGDCFRASIASILELPTDQVPHFCDMSKGNAWKDKSHYWLIAQGYAAIWVAYATPDLKPVLDTIGVLTPGVYCILGGTSKNGCGHCVVACDGAIVHDPSMDESGIVGPMEDGLFWVLYIGAGIAQKYAGIAREVRREAA